MHNLPYRVGYHKNVLRFFSIHPDIEARFFEKLPILRQNPFSTGLDVVSLKGKPGHYRLRIGKYRFLYEIQHKEIIIYFYDADTRGDIYK